MVRRLERILQERNWPLAVAMIQRLESSGTVQNPEQRQILQQAKDRVMEEGRRQLAEKAKSRAPGKEDSHSITVHGQILAGKQYPEFQEEFQALADALFYIVQEASHNGLITLTQAAKHFPVACHNQDGEIIWNISPEDIELILDGSPYNAEFVISQIAVHESCADERSAIEAQIACLNNK